MKEVVAFYRTSTGAKVIKATNALATNIYDKSSDGRFYSGAMSYLNIDKKELGAKLAGCMKNHTVEDLKKYIEIRNEIKSLLPEEDRKRLRKC